MTAYVADTHAVIWYLLDSPKLSKAAKNAFESAAEAGDPVYVSAITLIEIVYLTEKAKIPDHVPATLLSALDNPLSVLVLTPVDRSVAAILSSIPRNDVPDMPDRIIAATASVLQLPLITRDHLIQLSGLLTVW
jgi:PIN domain nuclease of toxin-antitoxin system